VIGTDRQALIELLSRWQGGEVEAWALVEEAEEAEEALFGEAQLVPKVPRDDPSSISIAVLELMATAPHQRLLPVDVPALVSFLQAGPGSELEAWQTFESYWRSVDMEKREAEVDKVYFARGRDGGAA
jgi:hypothetical protein